MPGRCIYFTGTIQERCEAGVTYLCPLYMLSPEAEARRQEELADEALRLALASTDVTEEFEE